MRSPSRQPAPERSTASSTDSSLLDAAAKKPLPAGLQKRLRLFACAYGLQDPNGAAIGANEEPPADQPEHAAADDSNRPQPQKER